MDQLMQLEEKLQRSEIAAERLNTEKVALSYEVETLKDELQDLKEVNKLLEKEYGKVRKACDSLNQDLISLTQKTGFLKEKLDEKQIPGKTQQNAKRIDVGSIYLQLGILLDYMMLSALILSFLIPHFIFQLDVTDNEMTYAWIFCNSTLLLMFNINKIPCCSTFWRNSVFQAKQFWIRTKSISINHFWINIMENIEIAKKNPLKFDQKKDFAETQEVEAMVEAKKQEVTAEVVQQDMQHEAPTEVEQTEARIEVEQSAAGTEVEQLKARTEEVQSEARTEVVQSEARTEVEQSKAKTEVKKPESPTEVNQPEARIEGDIYEAGTKVKQSEAPAEEEQPEASSKEEQPEASSKEEQPQSPAAEEQPKALTEVMEQPEILVEFEEQTKLKLLSQDYTTRQNKEKVKQLHQASFEIQDHNQEEVKSLQCFEVLEHSNEVKEEYLTAARQESTTQSDKLNEDATDRKAWLRYLDILEEEFRVKIRSQFGDILDFDEDPYLYAPHIETIDCKMNDNDKLKDHTENESACIFQSDENFATKACVSKREAQHSDIKNINSNESFVDDAIGKRKNEFKQVVNLSDNELCLKIQQSTSADFRSDFELQCSTLLKSDQNPSPGKSYQETVQSQDSSSLCSITDTINTNEPLLRRPKGKQNAPFSGLVQQRAAQLWGRFQTALQNCARRRRNIPRPYVIKTYHPIQLDDDFLTD